LCIVGWAAQIAGCLFVDRHWETDKPYLDSMLNYFSQLSYVPQFLLFPEGIDFDDKARARSDAFAAKKGFKTYTHVVHPRTTGFAYLASYIRQSMYNSSCVINAYICMILLVSPRLYFSFSILDFC